MDTPSGQAISVSLRVAKAMSLARQGKVKEAETTIAADRAVSADPLSLEVLAVIVTAEGDYGRALQLWGQLLQRVPTHAEAKRMIAALELWLSRPPWARYVPAALATLVAVLVVGLFLALTWEPPKTPSSRPTVSPVAVPPRSAPASRPLGSSPPPTIPGVNFNPPKQPQPPPPRQR